MLTLDKEYDRWSLERISRHVLYWGFWLMFYGVVNSAYHDRSIGTWLLLELETMTMKIPYSYFMAYFLVPRLLTRKRYILLALLAVCLAYLSMSVIFLLSTHFPHDMGSQPKSLMGPKMIYRTLDLIYIAGLFTSIKFGQKFLIQSKIHSQLTQEKINAELKILKHQLQPHFLFNTLNNIYGLVLTKDDKAADALLQLSDMVSYMLYECNEAFVSLEKEVQMLRNYLQLEQIRYGDRLKHDFEVNGLVYDFSIAPLLLIAFLENAYKHGASKDQNKPWIKTKLSVENNKLTFVVENSLPNEPELEDQLKSGIGLENVRKRLELIYPDQYVLNISKRETFKIELIIEL